MDGRVPGAWRQLRWSLAQRGAAGTLRVLLQRVRERQQPGPATSATPAHPFDQQYGVDTAGFIGGGALSSGGAHDRFTTGYHAIPPSRLRAALKRWRATPGTRPLEDYAFVDIGCGKARALMVASEIGFREVVGVEMNHALVVTAEANLQTWRQSGRSQTSMRLIEGDATRIELPDVPLLVFLYNPFQAPVLRLLLQRLSMAVGERSGIVDVLYAVPSQEAVFTEFPSFRRLWNEAVPMSLEDASADAVSSSEDRCSLWRL